MMELSCAIEGFQQANGGGKSRMSRSRARELKQFLQEMKGRGLA